MIAEPRPPQRRRSPAPADTDLAALRDLDAFLAKEQPVKTAAARAGCAPSDRGEHGEHEDRLAQSGTA